MGRCNNQRTRQRAEENKNTAARARFSKGPPKKSASGRGNSGGRQGRGNAADAADGPKSNVVQKITKRVEEKKVLGSNSSFPVTTRGHPLDGVDISKLDEITLSERSVQLVTNLLRNLNVMENVDDSDKQDNDTIKVDHAEKYTHDLKLVNTGYEEYEDDVEFMDEENRAAPAGGKPIAKELPHVSLGDEAIRNSPHFKHLTLKLSFSDEHALRACRGIKSWNASTDEVGGGNNEELALAMDWLCLHLSDEELKKGFKVNPSSVAKRSPTGVLLVGSGRTRAIPHPSISIAKPLGTDTEWRESVRRDARTVGFIRLGFSSKECEHACIHSPDLQVKNAEDDEDALRMMLGLLEIEAVGGARTAPITTAADLAFANEEQEQELHTLRAIFDERFRTRESIHAKGRFMIKITLVEELDSPGDSQSCWMHVLPREGYPTLASALLLFTNPSLPPSLLRRINCQLAEKASRLIGEPAIFSLIDFLSNNVHAWQLDFVKEQRAKEMEAVQLKMRYEAGHDVNDLLHGNIGRRQKAKLKSIEKAYDRPDQIREEYEERRRHEAKRLARIEAENKAFRPTLAQREIEKRNRDRIEDEAEKAARFAMNRAFNEGKSAQEARRLAHEARTASLIHNGVETPLEGVTDKPASVAQSANVLVTTAPIEVDESEKYQFASEIEDTVPVTSADKKAISSTSMAFMERLREYYTKAATLKRQLVDPASTSLSTTEENLSRNMQILLREPTARPSHREGDHDTHIPAPIPIPTGDLGKVIQDVIELQREQPWLIAGEARAPCSSILASDLTSTQIRLRNETSKRLRADLEWKYRAADQVGERKQGGVSPLCKNGTIPERFHLMLCQRRRLPTYTMKDDIIKIVEGNQICVISGDTGCGKLTLGKTHCLFGTNICGRQDYTSPTDHSR
jgi:RWD domain